MCNACAQGPTAAAAAASRALFPWTKKEMEKHRNIKSNVVCIYIYISYIYVFAVKLDSVKRRTRCREKKFAYFVDERAGRQNV
jgi:CRISPR/Cas system-associated endonuclease Cas3-HD